MLSVIINGVLKATSKLITHWKIRVQQRCNIWSKLIGFVLLTAWLTPSNRKNRKTRKMTKISSESNKIAKPAGETCLFSQSIGFLLVKDIATQQTTLECQLLGRACFIPVKVNFGMCGRRRTSTARISLWISRKQTRYYTSLSCFVLFCFLWFIIILLFSSIMWTQVFFFKYRQMTSLIFSVFTGELLGFLFK